MTTPITIIVPTFNNPQYLNPCLLSIFRTGVVNGLAKILVVNNGSQPIKDQFQGFPNFEVLNPRKNLGWENGLRYGIDHTDSPFLVFQNDDTFIPKANAFFYNVLLRQFEDPTVAAVGPATTTASGWHSVFLQNPLVYPTAVSYLIFFTVMIRRSDYEMAGGLDTTCPGGDDLDLSIRLRRMGKRLIIQPDAFLIHHAFKTGERVRGGPDVAGGWNSKEMIAKTDQWLIQKHGFKAFMDTMRGLVVPKIETEDLEGRIVGQLVEGSKIVELGCGAKKTVPQAIGVDLVPRGCEIPNVAGAFSVTDIVGNITEKLPFDDCSQDTLIARHILEHCIDSIQTLKHWNRILKMNGRLIVAVPDESKICGIPMNPEHVHAFTPESLKNLLTTCGFKEMSHIDPENGISFVACFEKVLHMPVDVNGKILEMARTQCSV